MKHWHTALVARVDAVVAPDRVPGRFTGRVLARVRRDVAHLVVPDRNLVRRERRDRVQQRRPGLPEPAAAERVRDVTKVQDKVHVGRFGLHALGHARAGRRLLAHVAVGDEARAGRADDRRGAEGALGAEPVLARAEAVVVARGRAQARQQHVVQHPRVDEVVWAHDARRLAAHHVRGVRARRARALVRVLAGGGAVLDDRRAERVCREHDPHLVDVVGQRQVALQRLVDVGEGERVGPRHELVRVVALVLEVAEVDRATQVDHAERERAVARRPGGALGDVEKVDVLLVSVALAQVQAHPVVALGCGHAGPADDGLVAARLEDARRDDERGRGEIRRIDEAPLGQARGAVPVQLALGVAHRAPQQRAERQLVALVRGRARRGDQHREHNQWRDARAWHHHVYVARTH
eukprot:Unigene5513_Nuclearia_a/m.16873 Unigene5513_Nuclearia_a/g.16873  ORF Unigene5513_Nuclearia_a/g.16873 Unigene5513_Nuclearia_a/m.16873 type:complete len:408 (+) Unigene5513_Nuclearia_a:630-1853(+)